MKDAFNSFQGILKYLGILFFILLFSCEDKEKVITLSVENTLSFTREEVVSINRSSFQSLLGGDKGESGILVKDKVTNTYLVTQWIDEDGDGISEELLFQSTLSPSSVRTYEITWSENATQLKPVSKLTTFSRFVPERTDDYAWENDKVAFRTYGPVAQQLAETKQPGGTLSSGIDLWLKRVDYSIIDKWYQGNIDEPGYYHIDHGEGYDPYHVGTSRGAGGIGIWEKDSLLTSKNFISYKTIATGPLRTVFELKYAPWGDYMVEETKRISLDLGSNFSKFEISLNSKDAPNYTLGITTHELRGKPKLNSEDGWFRYWEKIEDSYLGVGIVIDPLTIAESFVHESAVRDQSQVLIVTKPNNKLNYYSGFGWTEQGDITTLEDWDQVLDRQALILANPLKIVMNN